MMLLMYMLLSLREDEEPKAPRHASAAAACDGNLLYVTATCLA